MGSKDQKAKKIELTTMPVVMANALPQYVFGTISPYPMDINVIIMNQIELR